MKLPRDVSGTQLLKSLGVLGYEVTRQRGSHVRIETQVNGKHKEVIPQHNPIKVKTLASIIKSISIHHQMSQSELIALLEL